MEAARTAEPTDSDRCAELCREALDALQSVRGGPLLARGEAGVVADALLRPGGFDRLLADSGRRVLVGTIEGAVVGLALGRIDEAGESTLGVIDACFVEPGARGVGVGRALVEGLATWFGSSGCRGLDVSALPGDRETKNFLEGLGFKARLLTMHRVLP